MTTSHHRVLTYTDLYVSPKSCCISNSFAYTLCTTFVPSHHTHTEYSRSRQSMQFVRITADCRLRICFERRSYLKYLCFHLFEMLLSFLDSIVRHINQLCYVLIVHLLALRMEIEPKVLHLIRSSIADSESDDTHLLLCTCGLICIADHQLILLLVDEIHDNHVAILLDELIEVCRKQRAILLINLSLRLQGPPRSLACISSWVSATKAEECFLGSSESHVATSTCTYDVTIPQSCTAICSVSTKFATWAFASIPRVL